MENQISPKNVLVIESNETGRSMIASLFAKKYPQTTVFLVGKQSEGREILQTKEINVIVVTEGGQFPEEESGTVFLEQVKQHWPHVRRVLMSGYLLTKPDPADEFLPKPFSLEKFEKAIFGS